MSRIAEYVDKIAQKRNQKISAKVEPFMQQYGAMIEMQAKQEKDKAQRDYWGGRLSEIGIELDETVPTENLPAFYKEKKSEYGAPPKTRKIDKTVNGVAMTVTEQYDPATKTFKEIGKIPKYKTGTATKDDTLRLENEAQKKRHRCILANIY